MRGASPGASLPWEGVSIPSQRGRESLCPADKHCSAFWRWAEALPHGPMAEVQWGALGRGLVQPAVGCSAPTPSWPAWSLYQPPHSQQQERSHFTQVKTFFC